MNKIDLVNWALTVAAGGEQEIAKSKREDAAMKNRNGIEHFWSPPDPNERILGMVKYQDMIVVATDHGVYIITDRGKPLPDWEVRKITGDLVKEWR